MFTENLKKGDLVCVISPSKSFVLAIPPKNRIRAEKKFTSTLGLKIKYSKNIKEKGLLQSSSTASRVEDLHNAFKDKKIKAIICAYGGFNSNTLLPYLNWELIKKNPKPFIGYSDITALLNAFYAKTGLVTYSGPTFSDFAMKHGLEYSLEYFLKCMFSKNRYEITPSGKWSDDMWDTRQDTRTFSKNRGFRVIRKGKAKGVLVGGNLCTLNLLQGTPYMPSLKDAILFLEDVNLVGGLFPREFERNLESLLQQKNARYIRGIVLGRFEKSAGMSAEKIKFIIDSKNLPKNIPVIANVDFGHTTPAITFPIGGEAVIDAKGKKARIVITKH